MRVAVVCQNYRKDRIIPRMSRLLGEQLGWTVTAHGSPQEADVVYLSAWFEAQRTKKWHTVPVAAYFTHREEQPPDCYKARYFDEVAGMVDLRIVTCKKYGDMLARFGPVVQVAAPVDRDVFYLLPGIAKDQKKPVVGFSGYTYANRRKGEDLVIAMLKSPMAARVELRASGRGWPVPMTSYKWDQMGDFYRSLDVLVCPSRVEGIPMPPLEALACGTRVVIPRDVGILDELMDCNGIHRYQKGSAEALIEAVEEAAFADDPADPQQLAGVVAPHSIEAWVEGMRRGIAGMVGGRG